MSSRDDYPELAWWVDMPSHHDRTDTGKDAARALDEIDRLRAENLALQRELAEKFGAAADVIKKRDN